MLCSLSAGGCSELRSQIYTILEGLATPDAMAMNSGSQPEWTRVIAERCPASLEVLFKREIAVFYIESLRTLTAVFSDYLKHKNLLFFSKIGSRRKKRVDCCLLGSLGTMALWSVCPV